MRKEKISFWDAAEHLKTKADIVAYLEAALEENDPGLIAAALGDIARARGLKVLTALGLQLHAGSGKTP